MGAEENVTFLDLACLFKIVQDTTLERFGSTINASVFDAANITGSLKQKGLIDFTAYYPGPNSIVLSEAGKKFKEDVEAKSSSPIDTLDDEILRQMSGGKRYPVELQNTLNVRSMDLAFRLYKLFKQNMVSYELKNGNVELMLTEQGFLRAKTPQFVQAPPSQPQVQGATPGGQGVPQGQQPGAPQGTEQQAGEIPIEQIKIPKKGHGKLLVAIAAVVVVIIVLLIMHFGIQPPII